MSVLLMLCVPLLALATPGRGTRRWEPCTGKGGIELGAGRGAAARVRATSHPPVKVTASRVGVGGTGR